MRRLNLFAKGNVDVRDSLLVHTVGGRVQWNGINEIVRARHPDFVVRVRHEVCTRSDAVLAADGTVPADLREQNPPLGPYTPESQFSRKVFTTASDVVALSLMSDVMERLVRHRREGYLFAPHEWEAWTPVQGAWLRDNFDYLGLLDVEESLANLTRLCTEIRAGSGAHVLLYNLSAVMPGELIHCYHGLDESFSTRIRRFNLGAIELSRRLGISLVDVDALVARGGADVLKLDPIHLTAAGHRLVAQEVVRILEDLGCFD